MKSTHGPTEQEIKFIIWSTVELLGSPAVLNIKHIASPSAHILPFLLEIIFFTNQNGNCGNSICISSTGFSQPTSSPLLIFEKSPVIKNPFCTDKGAAVYNLTLKLLSFQPELSQRYYRNCKCQRFELAQRKKKIIK